jgi:hypothetical protein
VDALSGRARLPGWRDRKRRGCSRSTGRAPRRPHKTSYRLCVFCRFVTVPTPSGRRRAAPSRAGRQQRIPPLLVVQEGPSSLRQPLLGFRSLVEPIEDAEHIRECLADPPGGGLSPTLQASLPLSASAIASCLAARSPGPATHAVSRVASGRGGIRRTCRDTGAPRRG